jgi:hypothetical protein
VRFSGKHVKTGWYSSKVKRVQHFEFLFDAVLNRLPFLIALLARIIKALKDTRQGIESVDGPEGWEEIEEVTRLTHALANLPTNTPVPMTRRAWLHGWDAVMRKHGDEPVRPHGNRSLPLGHYVQFILAITQWGFSDLSQEAADGTRLDGPFDTILRNDVAAFRPLHASNERRGVAWSCLQNIGVLVQEGEEVVVTWAYSFALVWLV